MIHKADTEFTKKLLSLPETGMGYQIIDAAQQGRYTKDRFVVYNSELILELDNNFSASKKELLTEGYTRMFSKSSILRLDNPTIVSRTLFTNVRFFSEGNLSNKGRHKGTKGATDNTPIYANGSDVFVRLSAYENDRRIDFVNMKLLSGTYTTTEQDYKDCKRFNDDPVDRYALPNDETIKWAFFIKPKSVDKYRLGIVQPANGHNGGGIEALFDNGTSNGTYFDKRPY